MQPAPRHAASLWPRLSSLLTFHFRISQSLYDSILPMVKVCAALLPRPTRAPAISALSHPPPPCCSQTQVAAQIKVRDLSRCTVTASPAGYSSWNEARSELMIEQKKYACNHLYPRA